MKNSLRRLLLFLAILLLTSFLPNTSQSQTMKREIDIGFASIDEIRPIIKQALSPQGKFVMLPGKASIMVIDTPQNVLAVEAAISAATLPTPDVALSAGVQTGLPPKRAQITVGQEVFFPTEYDPATILINPVGGFTVIPPTPTKFVKRNIGFTSDTTSTVNPDGTITLDINMEHTEFEGFINYGSAILPGGQIGTVPVSDQTGNPQFFTPFLNNGGINMPIISTTRISTSIIVRPRVSRGVVSIDMMPQLTVDVSEPGVDDIVVNLKEYQTTLDVKNNTVGRIRGFNGASKEFNKEFLGVDPGKEGDVAIVMKVKLKKPAEKKADAK